jgi:hypothetical protein
LPFCNFYIFMKKMIIINCVVMLDNFERHMLINVVCCELYTNTLSSTFCGHNLPKASLLFTKQKGTIVFEVMCVCV